MMKLPPNFQVGHSNRDGDCFFDSVAQGLKQLKPELDITVKSLRLLCKSFAQGQLNNYNELWLKEALKGKKLNVNMYTFCIESSVCDLQQKESDSKVISFLGLPLPIWGRSEIEGRIICAEYDVKLHVVERHIVEGKEIWTHKIVDSKGFRSVEALAYQNEENTLHIVNRGDLHYVPILRINAVRHKKKRSPDPCNDVDEKDAKIEDREKLFCTVSSNDSEAEKVATIRKLFEKLPKPDINFQGINNDTSLHIAVRKMELQVIELLVKKGARTEIKNDMNRSPIDEAKCLKRQDIIKILIPDIQQNFIKAGKGYKQENRDKSYKKSEREKGISSVTDGELPSDKQLNLQKDDIMTKRKHSTYTKRPGTSGISGQLYETELLMMFLLQTVAKKEVININSFYLATNMQEAGDFDDVVFKYKYFDGVEKSIIIFLQAKHKEADKGKRYNIDTLLSQSDKGDFILRKYLSSYIKIKQVELGGNHPLFQGGINKSNFVIYTNSAWNFDQNSDCVKKKKLKPKDMLHFEDNPANNYYKMKSNETVKNILRSSLDFEILVKELAQSVYSGSIELNKLIFKDYHVSLVERVIQISETNKKESKLRQDFLDGTQEAEFSYAFLEEIQNNRNFSKNFFATSDTELKEELKNKIIKLPENFGLAQENEIKLQLPSKTIPDKTIKAFLKNLKLFINQPNVNRMEDTIKKIIKQVFMIEQKVDANLIYCDIHNKITKWWRVQDQVKYLTEHDKLFSKAKENLSNMKLVGLVILYANRIKNLGYTFKSVQIRGLTNLIRENRVLNIISHGDAMLLSTVKVYQALEGMTEYKSEDDNYKYIFLSLTSALELQNKVIDAFNGTKRDLLVIECEGTKTSFGKLYDQLVHILKHNHNKKIVLITRENDPFAEQFKRDFSRDSQYVEKVDQNNTLADLDIESQAIIKQKQVIFQGVETKLGTLVDKKSKHLIGADDLSKLITNKKIKVDKAPGNLGEVKYYYINRIFHRRVNIKTECFKEKTIQDIFVVSNLKENELSLLKSGKKVCKFADLDLDGKDPVKFIIIDDDEYVQENLKLLYKKYQTYNIHWLKKEDNNFLWQQSHGSLSNLREFLDTENITEYPADRITNIPDRVVIVSSEPGMGKSVLLTKQARKEKKTDPSLWVARINLSDFTKQLKKMHFDENNLNGTINFLSDILDLKTSLERKLFKHRVENQGKITLLFDGFDEISPDYKNKVIALVKILKETKVDKLWITTRPHMKDELENELSVFSYSVKPLSAEDQKDFLKRFWGRKLGLKDDAVDNRLNTYIERLLNVLSSSIADKARNFAGIPLQARMVAEVYQDKFKKYYNSDQKIPIFPNKLDLLDLYHSFVEKKYKIYWVERNKADITNPGIKKLFKEYRSKFILNHQLLALEILFSDQEVNSLLSLHEQEQLKDFKNKILAGNETTGIINPNFNETLNFIHRTYAEYFAALWLADKEEIQEVKNILYNKLFESENRVLRNFFDRILASGENNRYNNKIHTAVLTDDINKVKELWSDSRNREVDKGGRTALHLAAAYGFSDIAQVLLDNDPISITIEDKIFGWRPLRYADRGSHWHVAELLLQRGANSEDMSKAISKMNSIEAYGETLLCKVAKEGLFKITEFLIQRNANIHTPYFNGMTPLHYAPLGGNIEVVKLLIESGFDVNIPNFTGDTVLHIAAKKSNVDIVKFLVEKGADLNSRNNKGDTVLHSAAEGVNWDVVNFLIEKGVDLSHQNDYGDTILHWATKKGNLDIVKFLVEKGADLNSKNNDGDTILHIAAKKGNLDIVEFLIAKEANFNCQNSDSHTVLHSAASRRNWDIVKILIENGADFNDPNNNGDTILHSAAFESNWNVVKFLVEKGAHFNCQNNHGDTILHCAAEKSKFDIVRFLILKGADFNTRNSDGHTVLHSAAKQGNWGIVKFLLENGANVNCQNNHGDTVLHFAAKKGKLDIVQFLLQKGANCNSQNSNGDTVLHSAVFGGNLDVIILLIDRGADFNCQNKNGNAVLHYAATADKIDVIKFLLEKGVDINTQNSDGDTALYSAAFGGNLNVVKYLTEKGADVDIKNRCNTTALHIAAFRGNLDVVKCLIEQGGDINSRNINGETALHSAAFEKKWHVLEFLIDNAADFTCQDYDCQTVLHDAALKGLWEVVKFMVEKGVNFSYQNSDGDTILHDAAKIGEWDTIEFLIKKGADLNFKNNNGDTIMHYAACWVNLEQVKLLVEKGADFSYKNSDGNTALHCAADQGNLDVVKFLVEKGADLNCQNKNGDTVLHCAAFKGKWDIAEFLIEQGADFNKQNIDGHAALHCVAEMDSWETVHFLIREGADLNCKNNKGDTILHYAAAKEFWDTVKFLVKKGSKLNSKNNKGNTVLHYAARNGNLQTVRFLINRGANLKNENCKGETVLHDAAKIGKSDVIEFLLEKGADLHCKNKNGDTVLHYAAYWDALDKVRILIEKGADFNCQNSDGDTVLHYAAFKGNLLVVNFLLEKGADIDRQNRQGDTALHMASTMSHLDVVKSLIQKGADFNITDRNGGPVLHSAAFGGNLDVVKFLVEIGADINSSNRDYDTALHSAAFGGNLDVIKFLAEKGIDLNSPNSNGESALYPAVFENEKDVIQFFIDKGVDINCKNIYGDTVLHSAAFNGNLDVMKFLIEKGADLNCKNNHGNTVLHYAAEKGSLDAVKFLMEKGADLNCKNNDGNTVLHYAAEKGNLDAVKFLMEKGANFNDKNYKGDTILHEAAKRGEWDVVEFLIEEGADLNCKNNNGDTILHYAAYWGNLDEVKILIEKGADLLVQNEDSETVLHCAAAQGKWYVVKFLMEKGADFNCRNNNENTVVHHAAYWGNLDEVKFFIGEGVNYICKNRNGDTALHLAGQKGYWDIVNFLIKKGSDFNCQNKNGDTILHCAAYWGNFDLVKFLIEEGADLNCKKKNGDTVLHSAGKKGNWDIVKFLIEKGADFKCKKKNGNTVLHYAACKGNLEVVEFLIGRGADLNCKNDNSDTVVHKAAKMGNWNVVNFLVEKGANLNCINNRGYTVLHYAAEKGNSDVVKFLIENGADFNGENRNGHTVLLNTPYNEIFAYDWREKFVELIGGWWI